MHLSIEHNETVEIKEKTGKFFGYSPSEVDPKVPSHETFGKAKE